MSWYQFKPYVPVATRQRNAQKEATKLAKQGSPLEPIRDVGHKIAESFWGKSWCQNLEAYSDFENRLPRGRTYVRNGSVIDLKIAEGKITSLVSGSELYKITIDIDALPASHWKDLKSRCVGQIGSLIELLQGKLSKGVMEVVTDKQNGLFPTPKEIRMECSCPDYAGMCKHIAATMYGVACRLDHQPELLFKLRKVDHEELIEQAIPTAPIATDSKAKKLAKADLSDVFGIDLSDDGDGSAVAVAEPKVRKKAAVKAKAIEKPAVKAAKPKRALPKKG